VIPDGILEAFIERIVVYKDSFDWHLRINRNSDDTTPKEYESEFEEADAAELWFHNGGEGSLAEFLCLDTMEEFLQIADTGAVDVAIEFVKANAVDIIIFAAYTLFTTALMLAGVIILLTQIKKLLTSVGSSEMPKGERLKIMFSGKRTVAYIIICVALTVIAML